jgi:hypothetical protein
MKSSPLMRQASFDDFCPVSAALETLSQADDVHRRGAVFTRREVVDFILDLVGYTPDKALHERRLLEPSFGGGDFLLPAVERLLASWRAAGRGASPFLSLRESICAVELHRDTHARTHTAVLQLLVKAAIPAHEAQKLADAWLIQGDFLLSDLGADTDFVVGNPPYVRQELIPEVLLAEYRARFSTLYDRADLYIPFLERSLRSLKPRGALGFICADRWMKNRYGGPLRAMVASGFHLKFHVDMTDTPAFHSEVAAYPAVTVITREAAGVTRMARRPLIERKALGKLAALLVATDNSPAGGEVEELIDVTDGNSPWVLEASAELTLVRRLEREWPELEAAGCKVGIGVATGADQAFIGAHDELDVEDDRKLALVTTRDLQGAEVVWRGLGVINPFADDGSLVELDKYPRLRRYLEARKAVIAGRHCAKRSPTHWFRTIDRITPALARRPKLLMPDIKGRAQVVHEEGRLYPHHNLYYIVSDTWDLRALQAVLMSGIARLFVATYSTRMRGGFLRFQAQYLRRIRLPPWSSVPLATRQALAAAALAQDLAGCNHAVARLYGLTDEERLIVQTCAQAHAS